MDHHPVPEHVPFGQGATGVGAAAETYFSEPATKLTVPQAAMLAALVNAPGLFNPDPNAGSEYTALAARWQYVLYNMYRDGNITLPEFTNMSGCTSAGTTSCPTKPKNFPKEHSHFATRLDRPQALHHDDGGARAGKDVQAQPEQLDTGGHKIHTTFRSGDDARPHPRRPREKNKRLQDGKGLPWYAHVAAILVQPGTGEILAFYGGPGYKPRTGQRCSVTSISRRPRSRWDPRSSLTCWPPPVKQGMNVQNSVLNGFSPI